MLTKTRLFLSYVSFPLFQTSSSHNIAYLPFHRMPLICSVLPLHKIRMHSRTSFLFGILPRKSPPCHVMHDLNIQLPGVAILGASRKLSTTAEELQLVSFCRSCLLHFNWPLIRRILPHIYVFNLLHPLLTLIFSDKPDSENKINQIDVEKREARPRCHDRSGHRQSSHYFRHYLSPSRDWFFNLLNLTTMQKFVYKSTQEI